MKPELHFSRFEFKYVLPLELREEVERELQFFMALDPYVSTRHGYKYFVRSLYFDDDAMSLYYEKTDGVMERQKFRIRTYTDDAKEDCVRFLEVKGRHNAIVYKHRVEFPDYVVDTLGEGASEFFSSVGEYHKRVAGETGVKNPVIERFLFDAYRMDLEPKVLIDYDRRPYVSKYAPDFRVTIDDSLEATVTGKLFGDIQSRRRRCLTGCSIIEVKFRRQIPAWFHRIIQAYELGRISVSKYCYGMEGTGLALNLE